MAQLVHHASIASMSLVGSSLLTAAALTNPVGLAVTVTVGAFAWITRHEWHRK